MHLGPRDHHYIIKMKDMRDIASPTFWGLNDFFKRKAWNINTHFRVFIIGNYPAKDFIKEKTFLIVRIDPGSKT